MFRKSYFIVALLSIVTIISASEISAASTGDVIKGSGSAVYYLGGDNKRHPFPSSRVYFTWYQDFSNVKNVSDSELASYQLGESVPYKPGVKLVKIDSTPKVYAIDNGAYLRWVPTEEMAETLYGSDWNKRIDDIPVTFFSNYLIGPQITRASDFNVNLVRINSQNIDDDRARWKTQRLQAIAEINKTPEQKVEYTPDASASTSITLSEVEVTASQIRLRWLSIGLTDLRYFKVYKNSQGAITSTQLGQFTDSQIETATTYTYYVEAINTSGELMATSNTINVTTPDS